MIKRMYLNTSILIKAVNPWDPMHGHAVDFLKTCCTVYTCIASSVHGLEPWRRATRARVRALLKSVGAKVLSVDLEDVLREAEEYRVRHGLSPRRRIDIAHLVAARKLGCRAIAAVDRFIKAHAKHFSLLYLNYYTGCRDP